MATQDQIDILREYVTEKDDSNGWTNERISLYIDDAVDDTGAVDLLMVAANIWAAKAGEFSTLVDVAENGSSRKLSDLHKNAMTMKRTFEDRSAVANTVLINSPRTRPIVRA